MRLSSFGEKFAANSGISGLMDDLGAALSDDPTLLFMGGGNPGRIESVEATFAARLTALASDRERRHQLLGIYQEPQGDRVFRRELARFLTREYGWSVGPEHIALANGSQSAFFVLYNLFAGRGSDGVERQIHLPLCPEYVGYRDIGLSENFFSATRPRIERLDGGQFKYHVDGEALTVSSSAAALCVSRPSNPTGNVISDEEVALLEALARAGDIPLIIDGAYGHPFPGLIEPSASASWSEQGILMLSLSKLGLPGVRSGIVIAHPDIAQAFARANTVVSLACGTLGPQLLRGMLDDGSLMALCRQEIQPYYRERQQLAVRAVEAGRGNLPVWIHRPEGAFFLWLWCEGLPIDSFTLYERLKARGVIVLPGNEFFIGTGEDWSHSRECLRISYAGDRETIEAGIALIMSELHRCYAEGSGST
ncbi:valine--pyruvate transaminase [Congregibacter litoralis]|uniref:Valine-pyruvate aminotransferase apoenzyme n=1 Tax=Congregibacter litoralis KT71 TaxID=314285 RepID=A4A811_9GAMM|nr:valine--pyruvate transaminase [Congregibacter litoralis]EAQ97806.1 valine-pyruvate aminotransferase apoenzyme [Congregibacter litoralis KT71]